MFTLRLHIMENNWRDCFNLRVESEKTGRPINTGYQLTCSVMGDEDVKLALAIAEKGKMRVGVFTVLISFNSCCRTTNTPSLLF